MNLLRWGLWGAASLGAMAAAGAASATTVIGDNVLTRAYYNGNPSNSTGYNYYRDTIGDTNAWDTFAIEVTRVGANFDFKIFTNKGSNSEGGIPYADLFIDLDPDNSITGPFDNWDIGLNLQNGKLYELDNSSDWKTSQQLFASSNTTYGGLFRPADCGTTNGGDGNPAACGSIPDGAGSGTVLGFAAPTKVDADWNDYLETIDVEIDQAIGDPYNASHVISFSIAASLLNQGGFDVFWGTAECANDSIWGHVPRATTPPGVPEPFALSLFGLGLAGAYVGARRRRRAA